jgi:hypothetical protein
MRALGNASIPLDDGERKLPRHRHTLRTGPERTKRNKLQLPNGVPRPATFGDQAPIREKPFTSQAENCGCCALQHPPPSRDLPSPHSPVLRR